jgi:hypothetical protein
MRMRSEDPACMKDISMAYKIFVSKHRCSWQDIIEMNPKLLLTKVVSEMRSVSLSKQQHHVSKNLLKFAFRMYVTDHIKSNLL